MDDFLLWGDAYCGNKCLCVYKYLCVGRQVILVLYHFFLLC